MNRITFATLIFWAIDILISSLVLSWLFPLEFIEILYKIAPLLIGYKLILKAISGNKFIKERIQEELKK